MKTEAQKLCESMTDEELAQCLCAGLKWQSSMLLQGEAVVDASSPFGRLLEAQEKDRASTPTDSRQAQDSK
jgi:hypothetical protein